jgi:hypothetical protein
MATFVSITVAGGVKSPAFLPGLTPGFDAAPYPAATPIFVARTVAPHVSDIAIAFEVLSDLVAEAARAEVRLALAESWDPSAAGITAEDLEAHDVARFAAGALLRMPIGPASDRPVLRVARFVMHCLTLDTPEDRASARLVLNDPRTKLHFDEAGTMTRQAAGMIDTALRRLDALLEVTDAAPLSDLPTAYAAGTSEEADPEVQAF